MGKRYLIDSNVIIDYLGARLPKNGSDFVEDLFNTDFFISIVVKIEILGFQDLPEKIQGTEDFINTASVFPLTDDVTDKTILLRRKYRKIKLGDSIIAATALINKLILITRNVSDFKMIENLELLNPWDL
jgi:predicted nucleic acid-binding protein